MLWSVEKSVKLNNCHGYALILNCSYLKMIVEVLTTKQILKSDIIYPIENALYLINNQANDTLKVVHATEYSAKNWSALLKANCK